MNSPTSTTPSRRERRDSSESVGSASPRAPRVAASARWSPMRLASSWRLLRIASRTSGASGSARCAPSGAAAISGRRRARGQWREARAMFITVNCSNSVKYVAKKRDRSAARRAHRAAHHHIDHRARRLARFAPLDPPLAALCHVQGHDAVQTTPEDLGELVRIVELWAVAPSGDPFAHRLQEHEVGVLFQRGAARDLVHDVRLGRHEEEAVDAGVIDGEVHVGEPEPSGALRGIFDAPDALERLPELLHVDRAELEEKSMLVAEVVVDRGGGVLDLLRDCAHGDGLDAVADEELACGVEDLGADGVAGADATFESPHGSSLTLLSMAGQYLRREACRQRVARG